MNKKTLVNAVCEQAAMPKANATTAVNAIFEVIQESLENGDSVSLVGFGSFRLFKRNARTGRNPRTGESISIPEKFFAAFTAGKALKEAVNGKR
jgi:DNA-binding protein HU-beta